MRRLRAPKSTATVALFPFLAVLICTMGSLILLLVVIARQAKIQADRAAEHAQLATDDDRQRQLALEERLATLRNARQRASEALARRRAELEAIEAQSRRLADELAELTAAEAALSENLRGGATAEQRAEQQRLKARIAELEARLQKARVAAAGQSESFAIVPYEGPNQTRRRPIYIECRADSVVLQPEGIVLTENDFEGPLGPGNPLAAGVRAAERYLSRNRQSSEREPGEPYPLLLVRPDGINSYYAVRAALRSWGADFGYELIEQDWEIDYKPADPDLVAVESRAVEQGRLQQRELAASYLGFGGGGDGRVRGAFRAAPGGGLAREGGGDRSDGAPPSYRVLPNGQIVRDNSAGSSGGSRRRSPFGRSERDPFGNDSRSDGTSSDDDSGTLARSSTGSATAPPTNSLAASGGAPGNTGGGAEELPPQQRLPGSSNASSRRGAQSSSKGEQNAGGSSAGGAPQNPFLKPAGASQSTASSSGSPGSMGGQPQSAAMASDQPSPLVLPQQIYGQRETSPGAQSLAETHGQNWALPDASRGSIPITRPIRVQCRADGLTLLPEIPGGEGGRTIPFENQTATSIDGLVSAIWERMDSWGIAGKGLYWRPELHMETTADGAARLAELKVLLADSGVTIYDKPATASRAQHRTN